MPKSHHVQHTHLGLTQTNKVIDLKGNITKKPLTYLDSTASSLPLGSIEKARKSFLHNAYANNHTTGHHRGRDSTAAVNDARKAVGKLVGYDPEQDVVIFNGTGATGPLNYLKKVKFSQQTDRPVILTTEMEHHANQLPWMDTGNAKFIPVNPKTGELDFDVLQTYLEEGNVGLLAISGASNVTGIKNQIYKAAKMAHAAGAEICVDAAQLAPHYPIYKRGGEELLDYIVLSPHKFGVPNTPGVLIANRSAIEKHRASGNVGGGIVKTVTAFPQEYTLIDEIDAGEEAGTQNIPGIVAVGLAADHLSRNMDKIIAHEQKLTRRLMDKLGNLEQDGVHIIGTTDPEKRVGVVSISIDEIPHEIVTAFLNDHWNIAVRNGCFCAHPYIIKLTGVDQATIDRITSGDRTEIPGYVRISFGEHNTEHDVDTVIEALTELVQHKKQVLDLYDIDIDGNAIRKDNFRQSKGWDFAEASEQVAIMETLQSSGFDDDKEIARLLPVFKGNNLLSLLEPHINCKKVIQQVSKELDKRSHSEEAKLSAFKEILSQIYNPDNIKGQHTAETNKHPLYKSESGNIHIARNWDKNIAFLATKKCPMPKEFVHRV